MRGKIVSAWSIEDDRFDLGVTIPPNATATVHVPLARDAEIAESGVPVGNAEGVKVLSRDGEEAVLALEAGR